MDVENLPVGPIPQGYATPEQAAHSRRLAQLLMMGSGQEKKPTHPLQAIANLTNAALGNAQLNATNEVARASALRDASQFEVGMHALGGDPQKSGGPASIRNNNPGAQWPGPVASQFGSVGAEDLKGGNKIAAFDSPVKGGAAHFALLAQKYNGMPLAAAINKWSGGNSSAPYAQFVAGRTGLDPRTPITHELLQSPKGIQLAKAMADWEAGGRYPMTDQQWNEAHRLAFGGEQNQALSFADEGGGLLAAAKGGVGATPPVPGGPVTRAPLEAGGENMLPSSVVPHRIPMSGNALINTLASGYLDPAVKQTALQLYLEQGQPMQMAVPGGTLSIGADGRQVFIPEVKTGPLESEGTKTTQGYTIQWDPKTNTLKRVIMPSVMGGQAGPRAEAPQPAEPTTAMAYAPEEDEKVGAGGQTPLGTPPPSMMAQLPTSQQPLASSPGALSPSLAPVAPQLPTGQQPLASEGLDTIGQTPLGIPAPSSAPQSSVISPDLVEMRDFGLETNRRKEQQQQDLKQLYSNLEKSNDVGIRAQASLPNLKLARQMIEDKNLYQGIFAQPHLDWNRIKALAGSKEGTQAAMVSQAFDKITSGQIVNDLKVQLGGLGQIRVKEMELVERAAASRYNTKEANRAVLNIMIKANEQAAALSELTANYLSGYRLNARGEPMLSRDGDPIIDENAKFTTSGLQKAKLAYLKAHPLLTEKEIESYPKLFDEDAKYQPLENQRSTRRQPAQKAAAPWQGGSGPLPQGWTLEPK